MRGVRRTIDAGGTGVSAIGTCRPRGVTGSRGGKRREIEEMSSSTGKIPDPSLGSSLIRSPVARPLVRSTADRVVNRSRQEAETGVDGVG